MNTPELEALSERVAALSDAVQALTERVGQVAEAEAILRRAGMPAVAGFQLGWGFRQLS